MKIKEITKTINQLNKLRNELKIDEAYFEVYVNDSRYGKQLKSMYELKYILDAEFTSEAVKGIIDADYEKTYNNTLTANINIQGVNLKVDVFIDC